MPPSLAAGEQAAIQVGVQGLRPELIKILGRLKYRTSYGQNVLNHSIETAFLAGMIAGELGANVTLAKKAGLLHDIGKAIDREVEGSHAAIGAELVQRWDKSPEIAQAIGEHHNEAPTTSILGYIISAADAISGARPGARRESWKTISSVWKPWKISPTASRALKSPSLSRPDVKSVSWLNRKKSMIWILSVWPGYRQEDRGRYGISRSDQSDRYPGNPGS